MRSLFTRSLLPAVLFTACTGLLFAEDSSRKKTPSPYSQLAKAAKNLSKIKGFKTTLTVQGGLSNTKDHKIHQFAVKESYQGDIYKGLIHISAQESYKTPRKGVRFFQGAWRNIYSDAQGKKLQTFFNFRRRFSSRRCATRREVAGGSTLTRPLPKAKRTRRSLLKNSSSREAAKRSYHRSACQEKRSRRSCRPSCLSKLRRGRLSIIT